MGIKMNNLKLRSKIILVYILCVLVPLMVTLLVAVGYVLKAANQEERRNLQGIRDTVTYYMVSAIDNAEVVINDVFVNSSILNFLDREYEDAKSFYKEYYALKSRMLGGSHLNTISGITFYSDNPTMFNGGIYQRIDSILETDWYRQLISSENRLLVYAYYDSNYQQKRKVSVIGHLSGVGEKHIEKIVKIDLDYSAVNQFLKNASAGTPVCLCIGSKIVFSNVDELIDSSADFRDISELSEKRYCSEGLFTVYGTSFEYFMQRNRLSYFSQIKKELWPIAVLLLADVLIPAIALSLFSNSITRRSLLLAQYMKMVNGDKLYLIPEIKGNDEIGELLSDYNDMVYRMKNLIEVEYKSRMEQQELSIAKQQAELMALHSQINPHFLFNILENFRMRSLIKGEYETSEMVERLAKLMRKSAEWGEDLVTIRKEKEFVRDYLELQKYRYGEAFKYNILVEEECLGYMIPSLVLVTFIENACVHGFKGGGFVGIICVSVTISEGNLRIEIGDTGGGMEPEKVRELNRIMREASISELQQAKTSLGLLNASIRLKKYCGAETRVWIESEWMAGTCIMVSIPLKDAIYRG